MNNQKGVTLVALITTIILLLIVVSISASTSMSTYRNMKYETFRAELQEVQDAVEKMCEEYAIAKEISSSITYSDFFNNRYSSTPYTVTEAISGSVSGVSDVATLYSLTDESYVYYFSQDEIKTFFNLEVSLESGVLVDFSTRYVYSIDGCADPDDSSVTYYSLVDSGMNGETIYSENNTASASSLTGVTVSPASGTILGTSDSTRLLKVTLTAGRGSGIDYPIKKAYYSTDSGTTYIEVDYLGDCVYADDGESVSFVIYEENTYTFKIEDTYGATATVTAEYKYSE